MKFELLSNKQFELMQTIKNYEDVPHRISNKKLGKLYTEIYNQFYKSQPKIYSSLYNSLETINYTLKSVGSKSPQKKIFFVYNFNTIKNNNTQVPSNSKSIINNKPDNIPHCQFPQKFISIDSFSNSQKDLIHLIKRYRELPHRLINKKLPRYITRAKINNLKNNVFNLFNKKEYPTLHMHLLTSIIYIKIDISLLNLSDKNKVNKKECIIAINYLVFLLKSLNNHNDPLFLYLTKQLNNAEPHAFQLLQQNPQFEDHIFLPLLLLHKYNHLFRPLLLTKIEEELYKKNYYAKNYDSDITFQQLEQWEYEMRLYGTLNI